MNELTSEEFNAIRDKSFAMKGTPTYVNKEVSILIPYRDNNDPCRKRNFNVVRNYYETKIIPELEKMELGAELIICDDDDPDDFNRGRALNRGVESATGSTFVFADADYLVYPPLFLDMIRKVYKRGDFIGIPFSRVHMLSEHYTNRIVCQVDPEKSLPSGPEANVYHEGVGGINIIPREVFFRVGKFCEGFRGWGFEDTEFIDRAKSVHNIEILRIRGYAAIHLYHDTACKKGTAQYRRNKNLHDSLNKVNHRYGVVFNKLAKEEEAEK